MNKKTGIVFVLVVTFGLTIVSCGAGSNNSVWGNFAGSSSSSLDYFKGKYEEIKKDGSLPKDVWGNFAGSSSSSLDYFKGKYEEIKKDGSLPK